MPNEEHPRGHCPGCGAPEGTGHAPECAAARAEKLAPPREETPAPLRQDVGMTRAAWEGQVRELKDKKLLTDSLLGRLKIILKKDRAEDGEVLRDIQQLFPYTDTSLPSVEKLLEFAKQYAAQAHALLRTYTTAPSEHPHTIPWNPVQIYAAQTILEVLMEETTAERLLPPNQRNRLDTQLTSNFIQRGRPTAYDHIDEILTDPKWVVRAVAGLLRTGYAPQNAGNYSHLPTTCWRRDFLTMLRAFAEDEKLRPYIFTAVSKSEQDFLGESAGTRITSEGDVDRLAEKRFSAPLRQQEGIFYHQQDVREGFSQGAVEDDPVIQKLGFLARQRAQEALKKMGVQFRDFIEQQKLEEQARPTELAREKEEVKRSIPRVLQQIQQIGQRLQGPSGKRRDLLAKHNELENQWWNPFKGGHLENLHRQIQDLDQTIEAINAEMLRAVSEVLRYGYNVEHSYEARQAFTELVDLMRTHRQGGKFDQDAFVLALSQKIDAYRERE